MHTQQWVVNTHTLNTHPEQWAVICCSTQGVIGGLVPCSRAPQLLVLRVEESAVPFTPPTYNSYQYWDSKPSGCMFDSHELQNVLIIYYYYYYYWIKCFFLFSLQIYNINWILKNIICNICKIPIERPLQILLHTQVFDLKRFKVERTVIKN